MLQIIKALQAASQYFSSRARIGSNQNGWGQIAESLILIPILLLFLIFILIFFFFLLFSYPLILILFLILMLILDLFLSPFSILIQHSHLEETSLHCVEPIARILFPLAINWNASCAVITGIRRLGPAKKTPALWLSRTSILSVLCTNPGCNCVGDVDRVWSFEKFEPADNN